MSVCTYSLTEMAKRNPHTAPNDPAPPALLRARQLSLNPIGIEVHKQRDLCRVERENGKYGGYWQDILKENLTERENALLICEICEGIMREAMISSSGKQFCSSCEVQEQNSTNKVLWKPRNPPKQPPNVAVRKMVNSLKCSCPLLERGCKWLGTISDCEDHLDMCGYVRDQCSLGCGTVVIRNKLNVHAKQSCQEREVCCEHCKQKLKFRVLSTHLKGCYKMELSCQLCNKVMYREYFLNL